MGLGLGEGVCVGVGGAHYLYPGYLSPSSTLLLSHSPTQPQSRPWLDDS